MQPDHDATIALIVVDVQGDFADPAGSLGGARGAAVVPCLEGRAATAPAATAPAQDAVE
jgi:nicotinamidase-related amidase